jgi:hypothetical protein
MYDLSPGSTSIGADAVPVSLLQVATTPSKNVPSTRASSPLPSGGTYGSIRPYWLLNAVVDYRCPARYKYVKQVKFELDVQNFFNT